MTFSHNGSKHTVAIKRKVYQHDGNIDLNYIRPDGKTNYEAMLDGKAPIVEINGVATLLDLHHLSQEETISFPGAPFSQGPLAEVPSVTHKKHSHVLHMYYPHTPGVRTSFRVTKMPNHKYTRSKDNNQFEAFKKLYWKTRAQMLMGIQV